MSGDETLIRTTITMPQELLSELETVSWNRSEAVRTIVDRYFTLLTLTPDAALQMLTIYSAKRRIEKALAEKAEQ